MVIVIAVCFIAHALDMVLPLRLRFAVSVLAGLCLRLPLAFLVPPALAFLTDSCRYCSTSFWHTLNIALQGISADQMNFGDHPVIIGMSDTFHAPGKYTLEIPCPRSRSTATIQLEMTDANGMTYLHTFPQSFHMHFYRLLKWMIAGPLLAMGLFVLVLKPENAAMLPS